MRAGSLCSGYLGLDMAVDAVLDTELAWVADNDPGAAAILAHRYPDTRNLGDIAEVDWATVEPVDVLTAGFPCQDVSCAGARKGLREGTRTGVWAHVARAIEALRPSLVVVENVRGLLSAGADSPVEWCPGCMGETDRDHLLRASGAVLGDLASLVYDTVGTVVSASDAGAPHRRERVFILAWPASDAGSQRRDGWPRGIGTRWPAAIGEQTGHHNSNGNGAPAEDPDRSTGGERRFPAPGQETGRGARADTGGPGGAPVAADTSNRRQQPQFSGGADGGKLGPAWPDPGRVRVRPWTGAGDRGGAGPDPEGVAAANAERDGRPGWPAGGAGEADKPGEGPRAEAARRGAGPAADADSPPGRRREPGGGSGTLQRATIPEWPQEQPGRLHSGSGDASAVAVAWGAYEPAIRRWEAILGRPAPSPTEPGRTGQRLSPAFVEWMQGLPEGWVTAVPGLTRNAQLKALGNGVVPQQAELALRLLLAQAFRTETAA